MKIYTMMFFVTLFFVAIQIEPCISDDKTDPSNEEAPITFTKFSQGSGPSLKEGVFHLLDSNKTENQSNTIGFESEQDQLQKKIEFSCMLKVQKGGDGGGIAFLNCKYYGKRGSCPYLSNWTIPNFKATFAIGIDVHNPPSTDLFDKFGNIDGKPQREISLHWNNREIIKKYAKKEFRDLLTELKVTINHVLGGAEVTLKIGDEIIFDKYFIPGMHPYLSRIGIGASTSKVTTEFDIKNIVFKKSEETKKTRKPMHFQIFNHVMTDNSKISFEKEIELPLPQFGFGRIIMTLQIHPAGKDWDEWDRCGSVEVIDSNGESHNILPFITSYYTPCHWKVDVTHFRKYLEGKTKIKIIAGTKFYKNRGFMMSLDLDFYHGIPEFEPYKIVPLWLGKAKYKSHENHFSDFFDIKKIKLDKETVTAKLNIITTGHAQVGEFVPSKRTITFSQKGNAKKTVFQNFLWKDDCYLNPHRPQFGTWKFSRAGWAPGDICRPWWIDLTPYIQPEKEIELEYTPFPYYLNGRPQSYEKEVGKAEHIINSYIILYRKPTDLIIIPPLRIVTVVKKGSAEKAGLLVGDYIYQYNKVIILSRKDLFDAMESARIAKNEKVPMQVYRKGVLLKFEVATGLLGIRMSH